MEVDNKISSRSWFCVLNNPQKLDCFKDLDPEQMVDTAIEMWCREKPRRSCAVNYEIGDSGTPHMHMVLEDPSKARFSALQKLFPSIHINVTKGNKEQAEAYMNKTGKFEEKNHTVIIPAKFKGEIKAMQGARNDLKAIEKMIEEGLTPNEIMDQSIYFRKHESLIRKAFFAKRSKETPPKRDVKVIWHTGESGSGKSYTYVKLCEKYGEDQVYLLTDYSSGGFDEYCGERVLFIEEFKGGIKYQLLLNYLDGYKIQIHCRYANARALWTEVHITSIYPPDEVYNFMVEAERRDRDRLGQLMRRIETIIYHYKEDGLFKQLAIPSSEYKNYDDLKARRYDNDGFVPIESATPFDEESQLPNGFLKATAPDDTLPFL